VNKVLHSSLITLVLAVVIYGAMALFSDGELVWQAIISLDAKIWIAILLLSLVNYFLRYLRWHCYINHDGRHPINHFQHILIYLSGFSLTMTPGKAGEAMRTLYLKKYGVTHKESLSAFFVERMMDLLAILILASLGFQVMSGKESVIAAAVTMVILAICALFIKIPKHYILQSKYFGLLPLKLQELLKFVFEMLDSASGLLSFKYIVLGLGLGIVSWACEGYGLFLVMEAYQPQYTDLLLAMSIYGMGILLGALSMSPGGLGASEFAMAFLLTKVGFDSPSAVAITYICRIATLWFAVLLGVVTMFLMSLLGMKPELQKEST
jgi:uncharacterized protein (TIRG00374 family)